MQSVYSDAGRITRLTFANQVSLNPPFFVKICPLLMCVIHILITTITETQEGQEGWQEAQE